VNEREYFKILVILLLVTSILGYVLSTFRRRVEYTPDFSIEKIKLLRVVEGVHAYLISEHSDPTTTDPRALIEITGGIVYPNETVLLTISKRGYMMQEDTIGKTYTMAGTEVVDLISLRFLNSSEGEKYIALLMSNMSSDTLFTVILVLGNKVEYYEAFIVIESSEVIEVAGRLIGRNNKGIPNAKLEIYVVENASSINPLTLDSTKALTLIRTSSEGEFIFRIINASLPPELKHIVILYRDLGLWTFVERNANRYRVVLREE